MDEITIEVSEDPDTISVSLPNYLIFMEGLAIAKYTLATDLRDFLNFKVVKFVDLFDYQKTTLTDEETDIQEEGKEKEENSTPEQEES